MFGPASNNVVVQQIWLCEFSEPCGDSAFHNRVVPAFAWASFPSDTAIRTATAAQANDSDPSTALRVAVSGVESASGGSQPSVGKSLRERQNRRRSAEILRPADTTDKPRQNRGPRRGTRAGVEM